MLLEASEPELLNILIKHGRALLFQIKALFKPETDEEQWTKLIKDFTKRVSSYDEQFWKIYIENLRQFSRAIKADFCPEETIKACMKSSDQEKWLGIVLAGGNNKALALELAKTIAPQIQIELFLWYTASMNPFFRVTVHQLLEKKYQEILIPNPQETQAFEVTFSYLLAKNEPNPNIKDILLSDWLTRQTLDRILVSPKINDETITQWSSLMVHLSPAQSPYKEDFWKAYFKKAVYKFRHLLNSVL